MIKEASNWVKFCINNIPNKNEEKKIALDICIDASIDVSKRVSELNEEEVNKDVEKAKEKVSNILGGLDTTEGNYANFDFTK